MKTTSKKTVGICALLLGMAWATAQAADFTVNGPDGKPLPLVMVTRSATSPAKIDDSDNGYAASGKLQLGSFEHSRFSDAQGRVRLPDAPGDYRVRLRKPGFKDALIGTADLSKPASWRMEAETDPKALAEQRPSNAWTSTLLAGRDDLRKEFLAQCGFCHQQGSAFLRHERSAEEWAIAIQRMVRYGARLSTEAQKELPALLEAHWKDINAHPEKVPAGMVFLRTPGGISHDPAETVNIEDVAKAIECGLRLLDQLASSPTFQQRITRA